MSAPTWQPTPRPTATGATPAPTTAAPTTSSPTYGYNEAREQHFGLRAGTKDGVLEIVAGGYRVAVRTRGRLRGTTRPADAEPLFSREGDLTLYFDGQAAAETGERSRVGAGRAGRAQARRTAAARPTTR